MEHQDSDNPFADDNAGTIPLIKIKIPKKAETPPLEEVRSHYCKECKKSFNSGKALGGHMSSAHVQANKDYSLKQLSSKRKSPGSYSGQENVCKHCSRVFQSKKSLFGHMRCHPERLWRGMEPPAELKNDNENENENEIEIENGNGNDSSPSSAEEEEDIDQIDSGYKLGFFNVKGWPTSKRGRGPVGSNSVDLGQERKEEGTFAAGMEVIRRLKEEELKERKGGDEEIIRGEGKEKVVVEDELYLTAIEVLTSGKREKIAAETTPSPEKYKCEECARVFSTHQALGGHRSSHNKFKISIINTNARDQFSEVKMKRKKKNVVNAASSSASGAGFAFDLNVAPAEEEEEIEDSSNHTS